MAEMKRIIVVGNSCSGKTTFAQKLSIKVNARHIELIKMPGSLRSSIFKETLYWLGF